MLCISKKATRSSHAGAYDPLPLSFSSYYRATMHWDAEEVPNMEALSKYYQALSGGHHARPVSRERLWPQVPGQGSPHQISPPYT